MIYLLTSVGLTLHGGSIVHINIQTIHRTTQWNWVGENWVKTIVACFKTLFQPPNGVIECNRGNHSTDVW